MLVLGGPGDGERGGMSVWECAGEGERRSVGICGVLTFGDLSGDCTSEKKDKCTIFVLVH